MFKFFSKNKEVNTTELTSILAEERKKQNEIMTQTIEKLNVSFQETLQRQQEEFIQKSSTFWNGYEQANANSLILLEKYKRQECLAEEEANRKAIEAQGIKAAYTLNMCMVSLSQIVDYNDINILHQEYDAILNNLNLEKMIKDEALLDALKKILDTCHFYILHEKDKEMLKKKQAARLKGALGKALGGKSIIAVFGNPNPWAIVSGAAMLIGSAVVSYKSEKNKAQMENETEEWELEKTALEQLHNLRKVLFETAWRLAEKYKFPDEFRLTEKQIKVYDDAIADADPLNRCERLDLLKDQFKAYPLFWYYLGRASLETADLYRPLNVGEVEYRDNPRPENIEIYNLYREKAKSALEKFIKIHSENQLLREDVVAASAYLDASDFYLDNPAKMKECIDNAKSIAGMNFEILQTCAFRYGQLVQTFCDSKCKITGKENLSEECREKAIYCLRLLLNEDYNPDLNGRALSQLYINGYKKDEKYKGAYEILKDCVAQKAPFIYFYIRPWNDDNYKKDLQEFFSKGYLLNTIGQYFEGCIRCVFLEFYQAVYEAKTAHDNTAFEILKKEKKSWAKESEYIVSGKFSKLDEYNDDTSLDIYKTYKTDLEAYVKEINTFIDQSKTTERKPWTLWLMKHNLDFSQEDFDARLHSLDETLQCLVFQMASDIYGRIMKKAENLTEERINKKEEDPDDWQEWSSLPTAEDFILKLTSFMTKECAEMRQTFRTLTREKFKFQDYRKDCSKQTKIRLPGISSVLL